MPILLGTHTFKTDRHTIDIETVSCFVTRKIFRLDIEKYQAMVQLMIVCYINKIHNNLGHTIDPV